MEPRWDRPLDGIDDVPWGDLLSAEDATELVAALRSLAEDDGSDHRILDVLNDMDYDFWYATVAAKPEGFRPAAIPALRFLARIGAQPSGIGSRTALDLVEMIVDAALDRPTMTDRELDAMVDGLRVALETVRPALAEAERQGYGDISILKLLADVDKGIRLGGAYEPKWRGVARPLLENPTGRLTIAAGMLVTREKSGLVFRSLDDGSPIHVFGYPEPQEAWPFAGSYSDLDLRLLKSEFLAKPFVDGDGPGVLLAGAGKRDARLWRWDGTGWRETVLTRPGLRLRSSTRRVDLIAAHNGTCFVGYADNTIWRFDARSGTPSGEPTTLPIRALDMATDETGLTVLLNERGNGPNLLRIDHLTGQPVEPLIGPTATLPTRYRAGGRPRFAFTSDVGAWRKLHRVDAESGAEISEPIMVGDLNGFCVYELNGRPCLAVAGFRQVHRFDAETGEPIGTPLFGHRRIVLDVASAVVDGRPTLYSADGATVRRWDAATGTPWPATITT